jgi:prepilin-type N-terminal cleavage/methylation domain-containing protein
MQRQSRRLAGDDGVSLPELLVTMAIFSIVMSIVFTAMISVQKQTGQVEATAGAVSQVRLGLAQIDKQIRSGNVLYSPADEPAGVASCTASGTSGTCMRVYTQTHGTQRCVQWQVIADPDHPGTNMLRSRGWASTWTTDGNVSPWSTVARGLNASPSVMPFTLQGGATAYKSRLLDVRLEAVDTRRPGRFTVITSSLAGRNTNYGYDTGLCSPVPPA